MEYRKSWMYGWSRVDEDFYEEVDKFIKAAKKHASMLRYNKNTIICPCKDCKNRILFADVDTIKSHLVMRGFVPDYTVWIHHGETVVVDDDNNQQEEDALLYQYTNEFMKTWAMTLAMNKVLALTINNVLMMLVVPALMAKHVRGIKMTVTIWRTCFGALDQRCYYKREVYKI
jgi:hypothetical protein